MSGSIKDYWTLNNMWQKWEDAQLAGWQEDNEDLKNFLLRFGVEIDCIALGLFNLPYDDIQPVMYLIAKIRKVMLICDFLDTLTKDHNEDVDKIKIFYLISHAEIAMNTLGDASRNKAEKVDNFFASAIERLRYLLHLTIDDNTWLISQGENTSPSRILYKFRCEYAHQGNFTQKVFKRADAEDYLYNSFSLYWDLPKNSTQKLVCGETKLTYEQFLNIYFYALKEHLVSYILYRT